MFYLINAIALAFAAWCWNRTGILNWTVGAALLLLSVLNAGVAYPTLAGWLQ